MLRLLPETLYAGLFPGGTWLEPGRGREPIFGTTAGADASALLAELETMLSQLPQDGRRRRRLHLVVTDGIAAIATLPWQDSLSNQDELNAYAQACYERQGLVIDEAWVTQTAFRRFGGGGLAYAFRHAWLRELVAVCDKFQVRLKTVLPVSAAAYWRIGPRRTVGQSLVLLLEAQRVTALVYEAGRLARVDVQPVIGDMDAAGARLLLRISASYTAIGKASCWSGTNDALAPKFVGACLPGTELSPLSRNAWWR